MPTDFAAFAADLTGLVNDRDHLTAALIQSEADVAVAKQQVLEVTQQRDAVQAKLDDYVRTHPDTPPPPPPPPPPVKTTAFGAYPGPLTLNGDAQSASSRARVAKALGVPVLPADRVYSETGYGKAILSPSERVAASYKQVQLLAAGDTATIAKLTDECKALAQKGDQLFDLADDHEIDNKVKNGTYTPQQYADSAKRFRDIVHGVGAPNLRTVFCTMAWSYLAANVNAAFYPPKLYALAGADCFDLLAPDAYYTARYTTPDKILGPVTTWSLAQKKPIAVWECGWQTTGQTNPNYTETQRQARVQAQVDWWRTNGAEYVLWFEALKDDDNLLEGHPGALSAYSAAAQGK